ncbi:hypothetical protein AaE_009854 [Aphanomyces astaci]|uniref:DDE Tnp4 domain-containing protein n=1 Tax=Aphanomyces astaci TaxID=112090 RepID=A0A6A5A3Y1_APHAT|nr:hypothetical protein AaE_009854 [Aphanomyces astaci]
MELLETSGHRFKNFPAAMYAVDVTMELLETSGHRSPASLLRCTLLTSPFSRPTHLYFSKKHGHYGFKVEVSVLPSGHAINVTTAAPGSIADIAICESNIDFHVEKLEKTSHDESMLDADPLVTEYPTAWALLADKGYQGLHRRVCAITPAKKPAGGMLSHAELVQNDKIASDRVIVENFFGRLKTLWSIASDKYAWKRENYDMFFQACVALTNVHIKFLPLREDDEHDHNRYVNRLLALVERTKDKRTNSATKSRDRRKQR